MRVPKIRSLLVLSAMIAASPALAQASGEAPPPGESEEHDLAKQLANPVASLISVPLQENFDFGGGYDDDGFKSVLNIQPVVPFDLGKANLIVRTILPVIYQNDITGPRGEQVGLGDITQSFFISPKTKPGGIIWAIGPVGYYPTNTDGRLAAGKWGAGVTGLVLKQAGKNTIGMLTNQIWSVAGNASRPDFSSLFLQPFYTHTTAKGLSVALNTETTYDWKHEQWTVPVNVTVTQISKIGKQRVSVGGGVRYYAEKPVGGPDWGVRLIFTLLFPKK